MEAPCVVTGGGEGASAASLDLMGLDVSPSAWTVMPALVGCWCILLGLLSALPLPPFAASEVVFIGVEALRRRRLPESARSLAQLIGFAALASLLALSGR